MIEHVAIFQLNPDVDDDKLEWMTRQTRMQILKIPFVLGLRCGSRLQPESPWAFFYAVEVESRGKLAQLLTAPHYVHLQERVILPNVSERLELDFRTDPGTNPLFAA